MRDYLHQWTIRNLLLAASIGFCGFVLFSDQVSAGSSSSSISNGSDGCEKRGGLLSGCRNAEGTTGQGPQ